MTTFIENCKSMGGKPSKGLCTFFKEGDAEYYDQTPTNEFGQQVYRLNSLQNKLSLIRTAEMKENLLTGKRNYSFRGINFDAKKHSYQYDDVVEVPTDKTSFDEWIKINYVNFYYDDLDHPLYKLRTHTERIRVADKDSIAIYHYYLSNDMSLKNDDEDVRIAHKKIETNLGNNLNEYLLNKKKNEIKKEINNIKQEQKMGFVDDDDKKRLKTLKSELVDIQKELQKD